MSPHRPYLAFFRAGPTTVHRRMVREDPHRNWDCCVNWWSEPPDARSAQVEEFVHEGGDNKFEGFADFFARGWQPQWRYRYVLVADDDVYFQPGDLSRFFALCERSQLYLSQPALRWGTNSSHLVTLWNPASRIRNVNFVEVMVPCFSIAALHELMPTFGISRSTFGTDLAWGAILRERDAIHVVDAVRVDHVRKIDWLGGAWYRKMRALGVNPGEEARAAERRYGEIGPARTKRRGHAARLPLGRMLSDALVFGVDRLIVAWWRLRDLLRAALRGVSAR